ncbi:hypothetical protein AHiyo6_28450 [Arthrobacter sp. Hiyo6]|jgi:hypothetical protein|nr:hypothetical protein AHiyo6_28450 [Arthrobacter sp. Hiyo6]
MAGIFELVSADNGVRIRIVNGAGDVLAVSGTFRDTTAAVAGISDIRELAASAHISDRTTASPTRVSSRRAKP